MWFARFAKSRSLAARLCAAGAVTINGSTVTKPNQAVRVGDIVMVPQGGWQRTVRVCALGVRRGPASEARLLYEERPPPLRLSAVPSDWIPLLDAAETEDTQVPAAFLTEPALRGAAYFISAMMSRKRGCSAEPSHSKTTISVVTISAPCRARRETAVSLLSERREATASRTR